MPSPGETLREFSSVVVTGGSSGIGKSFIELCGKLHPGLAICNLSRSDPSDFFREHCQLKVCHVPCDLASEEETASAAAAVEAALAKEAPEGRVLLVNNSGFGSYGPFPEPGLERHLGIVDVNVRAVVQLTGLLLPLLRRRGGAVVTIASAAAFQPTPWFATYGASKAFVLHWSLALNEELRGTGVRALAVCPGPTATRFGRNAGMRPGAVRSRLSQTADEVVLESLRALGAGRSQVVTGWTSRVAAVAASILPKPAAARLARRVLASYRTRAAP
jgi:short-subunit dehydrogenase